MKKKAGPVAISVAVVAVIVFLVVMYRVFFPPQQPPDTANPKSMPAYAQQAMEFIKNHKGERPPGAPGGAHQPSVNTNPGH